MGHIGLIVGQFSFLFDFHIVQIANLIGMRHVTFLKLPIVTTLALITHWISSTINPSSDIITPAYLTTKEKW